MSNSMMGTQMPEVIGEVFSFNQQNSFENLEKKIMSLRQDIMTAFVKSPLRNRDFDALNSRLKQIQEEVQAVAGQMQQKEFGKDVEYQEQFLAVLKVRLEVLNSIKSGLQATSEMLQDLSVKVSHGVTP
jgi:tetrahydromethanopterin S-methyltransferase subunit G